MKTITPIFTAFLVVLISSCTDTGGSSRELDGKPHISQRWKSGYLFTKTSTDYDFRVGYEVLVYRVSQDSVLKPHEVWVPHTIYEQLPEPSDTSKVSLLYIEGLTFDGAGETESGGSWPWTLYDDSFDLVTDFKVLRIHADTIIVSHRE